MDALEELSGQLEEQAAKLTFKIFVLNKGDLPDPDGNTGRYLEWAKNRGFRSDCIFQTSAQQRHTIEPVFMKTHQMIFGSTAKKWSDVWVCVCTILATVPLRLLLTCISSRCY